MSASLGRWSEKASSLARVFRIAGTQMNALEASVRYRDGTFTGQRMMVEGVDSLTALAILNVLGFDLLDSLIVRAADLARGLPVIGGWDAGGEELVGKFYINASDASAVRRQQLARALDLPGDVAPHVIGFNVRHGDEDEDETVAIETKVYDQGASLDEFVGAEVPVFVVRLLGGTTPAGIVRSRIVESDGVLATKAWFVAPRAKDVLETLARLEAFDAEQAHACLPFDPGAIKSLGGPPDGSSWTIYFKPKGQGASPYALDPVACFSTNASTQRGELGLYITPNEHVSQAYCRTARHALSYRVRDGQPAPGEIDTLMAWSQQLVQTHEDSALPSTALSSIDFSSPPEPWTLESV